MKKKSNAHFTKFARSLLGLGTSNWTPKNPPQFTIAAYLEEKDQRPFYEVVNILRIPEHRFRWFLNLHCTLISLSTQLNRINNDGLMTARSIIKEFFCSNNVNKLKVKFSLIRHGEWDNHKHENDGTVIALGSIQDNEYLLKVVMN